MLKNVAKDKAFYYSYDFDLTKSVHANIQQNIDNNLMEDDYLKRLY
jgi:hypothetical protein